nr:glycosyltransferase [Anaerolineae bacterium]
MDPRAVLAKVRPLLREGGYVLASIPNIAHVSVRIMLLDGKFAYTEKGLLDRTHLRFFAKTGIETLFQEAGYSIRVWRRTLTETLVDPFADEMSPGESELPPDLVRALKEDSEALTYQFVVRAYPRKARRLSTRKPKAQSAAKDSAGGAFTALKEAMVRKDEEITGMRSILAERDAALAASDAALAAKDEDLAQKNKDLAQREVHLRDLQMQLQATTSTLGYRLLERVRRGINWLAPVGSRRRVPLVLVRRALHIFLTEGWMPLLRRLLHIRRWAPRLWRTGASATWELPLNEQYQLWLRYHTVSPRAERTMRKEAKRLKYRPKVSIIMPVYNTDPRWLREAVESVRRQVYDNWELCVADDGSTRAATREVLRDCELQDPRIKVKYSDRNGGIGVASNEALSLATGEFIGLLDHDDELRSDALFEVVKLLNERRDLDYIY